MEVIVLEEDIRSQLGRHIHQFNQNISGEWLPCRALTDFTFYRADSGLPIELEALSDFNVMGQESGADSATSSQMRIRGKLALREDSPGNAQENLPSLLVDVGPVHEWCIEYDEPAALWVSTDRAWYELRQPSTTYAPLYRDIQTAFDVCSALLARDELRSDTSYASALVHIAACGVQVSNDDIERAAPIIDLQLSNMVNSPENIGNNTFVGRVRTLAAQATEAAGNSWSRKALGRLQLVYDAYGSNFELISEHLGPRYTKDQCRSKMESLLGRSPDKAPVSRDSIAVRPCPSNQAGISTRFQTSNSVRKDSPSAYVLSPAKKRKLTSKQAEEFERAEARLMGSSSSRGRFSRSPNDIPDVFHHTWDHFVDTRLRKVLKSDPNVVNMRYPLIESSESLWERTPLHMAVVRKQEKACSALLEAGAPVDARDRFGSTPLHLAAQMGLSDILRLLIQNGADCSPKRFRGLTPLHDAARESNIEAVAKLLLLGADPHSVDEEGRTPLVYATDHRIRLAIHDPTAPGPVAGSRNVRLMFQMSDSLVHEIDVDPNTTVWHVVGQFLENVSDQEAVGSIVYQGQYLWGFRGGILPSTELTDESHDSPVLQVSRATMVKDLPLHAVQGCKFFVRVVNPEPSCEVPSPVMSFWDFYISQLE